MLNIQMSTYRLIYIKVCNVNEHVVMQKAHRCSKTQDLERKTSHSMCSSYIVYQKNSNSSWKKKMGTLYCSTSYAWKSVQPHTRSLILFVSPQLYCTTLNRIAHIQVWRSHFLFSGAIWIFMNSRNYRGLNVTFCFKGATVFWDFCGLKMLPYLIKAVNIS